MGKTRIWNISLIMFKELIPLKDAFPELVKLIKIARTIAVNTAHCKRSFSALRLTFDQQCANSD